MTKERGSKILRTPPGYQRYHEDPFGNENDEKKISTEPMRREEQSKDYINDNLVGGKQFLAKHFEMKNRIDILH